MKKVKEVEIIYYRDLNDSRAINESIRISNEGKLEFKSVFDYLAVQPFSYHHILNDEEFEKISKVTVDYVTNEEKNESIVSTQKPLCEIRIDFYDDTTKLFRSNVDRTDSCFKQFKKSFLNSLNVPVLPLLFENEES